MIDEKYVELIHREIDGLNSEKERTELEAYLEKNPQAQRFFRELSAVAEKLGAVNLAEPPEHLKTVIMNSIPGDKYAPAKKTGLSKSVAWIFALKPRFQVALAFSGGLAAGLLLFALFTSNNSTPSSSDPANLYGTLALQASSEKIPATDQFDFTLEQVQGTAILKASGKMIFVELDLRPQTNIGIQLEFNREELRCIGFISNDESPVTGLNIDGQSVKFSAQNNGKIRFFFHKTGDSDSPLKLLVSESGNVLFQRELTAPR